MVFSQGQSTMFGDIFEKNVYFVIDISGSMYNKLACVKEHLIELLTNRAVASTDTMFNVIAFKDTVEKWADRLIRCTPITVNLAACWIRKLSCGTSTNALAALYQAVQDGAIEAIYMVTDGLPDQRPTVIFENIQSILRGIPVHSIYLSGRHSDPAARDFLRDMAAITRGSSHIITLSTSGHIERVMPIYNCSSINRYHQISLDDPITPYLDLPYDTTMRSTMTPLLPVPPPSSMAAFTNHTTRHYGVDPKVLDYADALVRTKYLAASAGIPYPSTPMASLAMKGVKVLARHDVDGLYYRGEVKEQGASGETFFVKFDRCPALRKSVVQETHVRHMITYQDAFRSGITLGDTVLSPWQQDGRYGPGTVLDGLETRDVQLEGEQIGDLLVTFYNGETVAVEAGVAVRVPSETYERIVRDLQLPESQRRKLKYLEENTTSPYPEQIRKSTRAWEDTLATDELLRRKIDKQLYENHYLLDALDLGKQHEKIIGRATSSKIPGYDSGIFSDDDLDMYHYDSTYDNIPQDEPKFSKSRKKADLGYRLRFSLPDEKVSTKSEAKRTEQRKPWQYCGKGSASASRPTFRKTVLEKPSEPWDKITNVVPRPGHEEYKTTAGVSFPEGTDRKFGPRPQTWHSYRQFSDGQPKKSPLVWKRKHAKHSEFQDVSGVRFPSKTDKKFTRSLDPNWRPETALKYAEEGRNWEDGLGHRDKEPNEREYGKLDEKQSNHRRYFKDIEDKVAVDDRKKAKSVDFRRQKNTERFERMMEADEAECREKANRIEFKTAKKAGILEGEKERTSKTETWDNTRIEFRRERLTRYVETEEARDAQQESRVALRQTRRRVKETERREEFHGRLREEWRTADEKGEVVRKKNEARQEWENKREEEAGQKKQARLAARQERLHRYRNRVFPG